MITRFICARCNRATLTVTIKTATSRGLIMGVSEIRCYPAFHNTVIIAICDFCMLGEHAEIPSSKWSRMTEKQLTAVIDELRNRIAIFGRGNLCSLCRGAELEIAWDQRAGLYIIACGACGWRTLAYAVEGADPLGEAVASNKAAGDKIRSLYSPE